jgi:hypothetical protein
MDKPKLVHDPLNRTEATASRTSINLYLSVVFLWAMVAVHHAYETARYHLPRLVGGVFLPTAVLILTLILLSWHVRTGSRRVYLAFSALVWAWWIGLVGLFISADHYVARILLFFMNTPLETLRRLWPGEQVPPNDAFHEGTGVLIFFCSVWVAIAWVQFEKRRRQMRQKIEPTTFTVDAQGN